MSERVICAVDCTAESRGAARAAMEIGSALGLRLTLLHVAESSGRDARNAQSQLESSLTGLPLPQDAIRRVEYGDAAEEIVSVAREEEAALILTGARRAPVRAQAVLGSVAARVIEMAPVPVVLVPPVACEGSQLPLHGARELVIGVDESRRSHRAVAAAAALAARARAQIALVHVVPLASAATAPPVGMGAEVVAGPQVDPDRLFARLLDLVPGTVETSCVVRRGVVGEQLEACAAERRADVIVVGSSRPGWFKRLLFGATAGRVVSLARRPVMVIPQRVAAEA